MGSVKVAGEWVPCAFPAERWHGEQFLSATLRWYSREEVAAGVVALEPTHFAESRPARTREEVLAEARWTLASYVAEGVHPRPGQTVAEAFAKTVAGELGTFARKLGVLPEQVWALVGVERPGFSQAA